MAMHRNVNASFEYRHFRVRVEAVWAVVSQRYEVMAYVTPPGEPERAIWGAPCYAASSDDAEKVGTDGAMGYIDNL
jgi:hypothetical protein